MLVCRCFSAVNGESVLQSKKSKPLLNPEVSSFFKVIFNSVHQRRNKRERQGLMKKHSQIQWEKYKVRETERKTPREIEMEEAQSDGQKHLSIKKKKEKEKCGNRDRQRRKEPCNFAKSSLTSTVIS